MNHLQTQIRELAKKLHESEALAKTEIEWVSFDRLGWRINILNTSLSFMLSFIRDVPRDSRRDLYDGINATKRTIRIYQNELNRRLSKCNANN